MLKILRHKGVMKILLWCVAGVIILSFGILSNAYLLNEQPGKLKYAGEVFGQKIPLEDFQRQYQFTIIHARLQYGKNFNQVAPNLDFIEQTWDRIILLELARQQRIKVTDNEVIQQIRNYPFFFNQTTETFDPKMYQAILRQGLRMSTRAFEEGVRDDLKIRKLYERETFTASVSDEEILEAYQELNEKMRVSYVLLPSQMFKKDVPFDEIKAKNYFLEHKRDFIQPATVNVSYLKFPFDKESTDSKDAAYDQAFNAIAALRDGKTLTEVAENYNISVQETGFFDLQKPDLTLGWPTETAL
jgi:hypothetical protein